MKILQSNRRKALILVDVQRGFMPNEDDTAFHHIKTLLSKVPYDLYVSCVFHTEKGMQWDKQADRIFPKASEDFENMIEPFLPKENLVHIEKTTKSCFGGDKDLHDILQNHDIDEVHLVGYDIYDCVFATAQASFDLGYFTYVIEECCGASFGK